MKKIFLFLFLFSSLFIKAQSLQHPVIFVTAKEKPQVLDKIKKYDWAKSIVNELHQQVDATKNVHIKNPAEILNKIPAFGGQLDGHNKILTLAAQSGMLYYLTDDTTYVQLSADILSAYINYLAPLTPQKTTIVGDDFMDPRTTYNQFAIAYDFIYHFLKLPTTKVYNKESGLPETFDNLKAQKAIQNIVGNALQEYGKADTYGQIISNHPVLTAPGALFPILCVDDAKERERLINVFWDKGTNHQNSFKRTILPMFGEQGIWPESVSYSFMSNISLILNVLDRIKPEMNVTVTNKNIFEGVFLFENLRNPDRKFVRYGDSKRNNDGSEPNFQYVLTIAKRKGYKELQSKAEKSLQQYYDASGGRKHKLSTGPYDNFDALSLFWGEPLPETAIKKFDYTPTVIIKHAGIALQRNYVEKDNITYGLCGIIGGATYVHSHLTGIAMELYGAGYVMAPNAGLPPSVAERQIPLHEDYFRLYAGNNTVIVNGTSHGLQEGSWKDKAYLWQNTTVNIAAEPQHLASPISKDFSFATQFLSDKVNSCEQMRTLSTIRTSPTTAYYFDMFRSKSLDENKFQDYIYHNLGDETTITDSQNAPFLLTSTERYKNDIGDPVHSPGWRYFEDVKVTDATNQSVKTTFKIAFNNRYMNMFVPGGVQREYAKALAPPSREAENGYNVKKTQVLAIRQQGEAWEKPFIAVFEPSTNDKASVQKVENLTDGEKIVGAKVISVVNNVTITDYIISQDKPDALYINKILNIEFQGRFGIIRTEETKDRKVISLYIGNGKKLYFNGNTLIANAKNSAFKIIKL